MATAILPGYPDQPVHSYIVTLGTTRYRLTYTWRERSASWYVDFALPDGTALVVGRRLVPGWSPLGAVDLGVNHPDGLLLCRGPEDYERWDLGADLVLVFVPSADLTTTATVSGLVVTQ